MIDYAIHRRLAKIAELDIFYRDTESEKPAILCLHGRWGRGETWVPFIRRYADRYRVIAPDQRGHGLSSKPTTAYTGIEMAADMIALLDALGIERAIVAGHSMGGRIAGHLAALHPDRVAALAILDKSARGTAAGPELPPERIPPIDQYTHDWPMPFPSLLDAKEFLSRRSSSPLEYDYFMASLVETMAGYGMMFSEQAMAANRANDRDWFDLLPRIACPTLLLRAKGGGAIPDADFERMRSMIPNCIAREASSPDHNVHLSNPDEFYGYFDELLSRAGS